MPNFSIGNRLIAANTIIYGTAAYLGTKYLINNYFSKTKFLQENENLLAIGAGTIIATTTYCLTEIAIRKIKETKRKKEGELERKKKKQK